MKPQDKKIIALIGIMGVGKTTIGFKLAEKLGIYFIDSDREIEDNKKESITNIFDSKGEEYFRKIECEVITQIVNRDEPMILSLGGGSFIDKNIRNLIKEKAISIWLYSDMDVIVSRVSARRRPLLKNGDKRSILSNLMKERQQFYEKADLKIDTSQDDINLTVDEVIKQVKSFIGK